MKTQTRILAAIAFALALLGCSVTTNHITPTIVHAQTLDSVLVHSGSWGSADKWKVYDYDGPAVNGVCTGNQIGYKLIASSEMATYWDSGVSKYRVPMSVLGVGNPAASQCGYSYHYNLTVGRSESTIEILD